MTSLSIVRAQTAFSLPTTKDIQTLNQHATVYWHESYYFFDVYHWEFEAEGVPDLACLVSPHASSIEDAECTTQYEDISYLKLHGAIGLPVAQIRTSRKTDETFMFMPDRVIEARQIKQWRANRHYLLTTLTTTEANLDSLTLCVTYFVDGEVEPDGSFCRNFPEDSMTLFKQSLIGTTLSIAGKHEGYRYQYEYRVSEDQLSAVAKTPNWFEPINAEPAPVCWQIGAFKFEHRAEKLAQSLPQGLHRDVVPILHNRQELFKIFVGPKSTLTADAAAWLEHHFPEKFPRRCTYRVMYYAKH